MYMFAFLDFCVASLCRGHANILCIGPSLTDVSLDPITEDFQCSPRLGRPYLADSPADEVSYTRHCPGDKA